MSHYLKSQFECTCEMMNSTKSIVH